MSKMEKILVGGVFGGWKGSFEAQAMSKIAYKLGEALKVDALFNGGDEKDLEGIVNFAVNQKFPVIYWLPTFENNYNSKWKELNNKIGSAGTNIIRGVTNLNGKEPLVTKLLDSNNYSNPELVLEIFMDLGGALNARVLDSIGNLYLDDCDDFVRIARVLDKRVEEMKGYKRVQSRGGIDTKAPAEMHFTRLLLDYFKKNKGLVATYGNQGGYGPHDSFIESASFMYGQWHPNFNSLGTIFLNTYELKSLAKEEEKIYGRLQNTKEWAERRIFSPVSLRSPADSEIRVDGRPVLNYTAIESGYPDQGEDASMHMNLYQYFKNARYIIHTHSYVENAPFTSGGVAISGKTNGSELIWGAVKDGEATNFSVNLCGHGSVVVAEDVEHLREIKFIARPVPEPQLFYSK